MKFGYHSLCSAGTPGPPRAERPPWAAHRPVFAVVLMELSPQVQLTMLAAFRLGEMPLGNQMGDERC